jgi:hypothetical protein
VKRASHSGGLDVEADEDASMVAEPDAVDRVVADQRRGHDPFSARRALQVSSWSR